MIAIITVEYNNPEDTRTFVASLGQQNDVSDCEVLVVDNSSQSTGQAAAALEQLARCPVRVLRPRENLYYWRGAAFALESLRSDGDLPRWVIICNNDITIVNRSFLAVVRSLDPSRYAVVAPRIVSEASGRDQNPFFDSPPPFLKRLKWRLYDIDYRIAKALLATHQLSRRVLNGIGGNRSKPKPDPQPRTIYAAHGACMIFSSAFFDGGGRLDQTVPMFAEELTVAEEARKLGLEIWYLPLLQVSHREHSATGTRLTPDKYEMERMARKRYYSLTAKASGR